MKSNCIICREPKDKFVPEHVFPAAIGGAFVILNVCDVCNSKLGKMIDDGLSKNKIVLFYRKIFDVKRKGITGDRKIQNPFKGAGLYSDNDGNKHFVSFNEHKREFETTLVPIYEEPIAHATHGWIGKMTIPLKEYKSDDEVKKLYAKKFGLNPSQILRINKEANPQKELNITLGADNRTFMLGCLKIAYEFAVTFIPKYLDDPYSKLFADILLSNAVKEEEKKYFDYDYETREVFSKRIAEIEDLRPFHHLAILKTIKGKGLYCSVKIFDWIYAIRLSDREDYLKAKELLIINDSIHQAYWMNLPTKLTTFKITTDIAKFHRRQRRAIQLSSGIGYTTKNGNLPVFDGNGKLIHKHLQGLANEVQLRPEYYRHLDKQIVVPVDYKLGTYYVKYFKDNLLIPLQRVDYVYDLLY